MLMEKIEPLLLKVQKPSRYIGGELSSVRKDVDQTKVRFAFCFPDSYDVGMSHLGMKILYSLINSVDEYWCERVFAPGVDYEGLMRENNIPLYGLESLEPIKDFDFVGFTLQYELSYTNMLNMLDLAGMEVFSKDRGPDSPIVIAGGPCACNPEPLADFLDICVLGEGEEVTLEILNLYAEMKAQSGGKRPDKMAFLKRAMEIEGVYVPRFYEPIYHESGDFLGYNVLENAPKKVTKRVIADFDKVFYPEGFVVPFSEIVHDRAVVEVLRGCIRGCRFCQAGFIYRPFREKHTDTILKETKDLCSSTGYEEISLSSLSTSDHTDIVPMLSALADYTQEERVNMSLPSLRVDSFSEEILEKLQRVRQSGLTFAPEAGTQRLRDVINKNITEEDIFEGCRVAFAGGVRSVKLYFMMGLPTETDEDIIGMAELAQKVLDLFYQTPGGSRRKEGPQISVSVATFVPKPFTPFQFEPQLNVEEIRRKQKLLLAHVKSKRISVSWHHWEVSLLEAAMAKGDRRLSKVIHKAWQLGCIFDSWDEHFSFERWQEAFSSCGSEMSYYAHREIGYEDALPWDHLDYMISKNFLIRENKLAREGKITPDCKSGCAGCGIKKECGGVYCGV